MPATLAVQKTDPDKTSLFATLEPTLNFGAVVAVRAETSSAQIVPGPERRNSIRRYLLAAGAVAPVSYTHLTLPTILRV